MTTENNPGHFAAVGIYVDAGSRYETDQTSGYAHIIDRMSFKESEKYSAQDMLTQIETLGGSIMCSSSRECIMYQAAVFPDVIPHALELLAETTLRPRFRENELEAVQQTIPWELEDLSSKPDMWLPEVTHAVAYGGEALGRPLLCPPRQLDTVSTNGLRQYWKDWYRPERMVVAGIGVDHDEMVKMCKEVGFADIKPSSSDASSSSDVLTPSLRSRIYRSSKPQKSVAELAVLPAIYSGGMDLEAKAGQEFTHIYLGFESAGIKDEPRLYAFATLQMLLGGGGSFSAGGPGKGMYSRLYTRVLNQHAWIESCLAFHNCYIDTGLFGISGSCQPKAEHALLDVMATELVALTEGPDSSSSSKSPNSRLLNSLRRPFRGNTGNASMGLDNEEVARAKNQLKSNLLMNLESRMVQLEDLGRQVQLSGRKVAAEQMIDHIDSVTIDQLRKVSCELIEKPATMVAQGEISGLQSFAVPVLSNHGITVKQK